MSKLVLLMLIQQLWFVDLEWRLENVPSEGTLLSISIFSVIQGDKQQMLCSGQIIFSSVTQLQL